MFLSCILPVVHKTVDTKPPVERVACVPRFVAGFGRRLSQARLGYCVIRELSGMLIRMIGTFMESDFTKSFGIGFHERRILFSIIRNR